MNCEKMQTPNCSCEDCRPDLYKSEKLPSCFGRFSGSEACYGNCPVKEKCYKQKYEPTKDVFLGNFGGEDLFASPEVKKVFDSQQKTIEILRAYNP